VVRDGDTTVIVDYAHTPEGLHRLLLDVRALSPDGRIITVFGCGGDRDRAKRPEMGLVASTYSDETIVTSDNPRSEDPDAIIDEVNVGECSTARRSAGRAIAVTPSKKRSHSRREATSSWWPARATRRHRPLVTPCSPSTIGSSRSSCYGGPRVESDGVGGVGFSSPCSSPSLDSLLTATILWPTDHATCFSTHDHKAGTPTMGGVIIVVAGVAGTSWARRHLDRIHA